MRRVLIAALLSLVGSALAQEPPFPVPCRDATACVMAFDAVPDAEPITYIVVDADTNRDCLRLSPYLAIGRNRNWWVPARRWYWPQELASWDDGSCFPREAVANHLVVYALNVHDKRSLTPSNVATFVGQVIACLEATCERRCWPGAPRRLPHLPEC